MFTLLRETRDGDRVRLTPGDHDFAHLLLVNKGHRPTPVKLAGTDPAVLLMSGGTTGTAKGVLGVHGAYVMAITNSDIVEDDNPMPPREGGRFR